jgi:phosphate/sulfate permease
MSFIDLRLLVAPLVSFAHCVVYLSLIYGFWLRATRSRKSMKDRQHNEQNIPKVQPEALNQ